MELYCLFFPSRQFCSDFLTADCSVDFHLTSEPFGKLVQLILTANAAIKDKLAQGWLEILKGIGKTMSVEEHRSLHLYHSWITAIDSREVPIALHILRRGILLVLFEDASQMHGEKSQLWTWDVRESEYDSADHYNNGTDHVR